MFRAKGMNGILTLINLQIIWGMLDTKLTHLQVYKCHLLSMQVPYRMIQTVIQNVMNPLFL